TGQRGVSFSYGHLLSDGTEDSSYHADSNTSFATAFPRPNGKIVVDGFYPGINTDYPDPSAQNAANGTQVQRINSDGSLDTSFVLDSAIRDSTLDRDGSGNLLNVYDGSGVLAVTADEKIVFGYFSRDLVYHLVRLNADGSLDNSFPAVTFPVSYS